MKILTKIQHTILSAVVILGFLCSFSPIALADTPSLQPMQTADTNQAMTNNKPTLHVQDFQEGELGVQFRYVNGLLNYIRFQNSGSYPIEIHIFGNNYVLGQNDFVVINPPKVRYVIFTHELFPVVRSWVNNVFPGRYAHEHIYRLPFAADNAVKN